MTKRNREAGQTIALVSFGLLTFLAAAGLAVDMGYLRYEKRLMQSAADSAALAAATDQNHGDPGLAQTDALAIAQADGFQNGVNNTTVNVAPSGLNPANAMEVNIQEVFPTFFMVVAGFNSSTITADAVATVGTSNGCMYALQVGGAGLTLNAGVDAPNCGIVDNGPLNGNGNINSPSIGVYGTDAYGGVSTSPVEIIPQPAGDPLSYLNPPGVGGGCVPDPMLNGTSGPLMNGVVTLTPRTYCSITINSGAIVTFNPGLYVLNGPGGTGLQINGTGIAMSAVGGVTFYVDTGSFGFNGTGGVTLTASDAGVGGLPAGILFYQDPSDTGAADVSEAGSGNVALSGTLYFPDAPLTIAGSVAGTNAVTVAQSITVTGTVILEADSTSVPGGSPLENVSLAE